MPPNLDHSSLARHGAGLFSCYPDTELIYSHLTTWAEHFRFGPVRFWAKKNNPTEIIFFSSF